jgi:Tol biopolymer transport system component
MVTDLTDGMTNAVSPVWSPTGDRIAYWEAPGRRSGSKQSRLAVYENGNISIMAEFPPFSSLLDWSSAGDGVYVAVAAGKDQDIYFVALDGSRTTKRINTLANSLAYPIKLSPDQKWMEYTERLNDIDNVVIAPLTGGTAKRVTSNTDSTFFYSGVTWSPDSKTLLYSKQTGGMQISLISETDKLED